MNQNRVTMGIPFSDTLLALKSATSTIPIVMSAVADPVKVGVAASLSRPGGNITGMASFTAETEAKRIQYLNEIVPNMKRVGFVGDFRNPPIQEQWLQVLEAAKLLGVEAIQLDVRSQTDIVQRFELADKQGVQALRVSVDGTTRPNRPLIIELAKKHKLPAIYGAREFADEGGLVSFSPDYGHLYWRAATMVDRIFKGENTADLPIELPTKFELLLNLKTAKALNLEISPALLARADEVIE